MNSGEGMNGREESFKFGVGDSAAFTEGDPIVVADGGDSGQDRDLVARRARRREETEGFRIGGACGEVRVGGGSGPADLLQTGGNERRGGSGKDDGGGETHPDRRDDEQRGSDWR